MTDTPRRLPELAVLDPLGTPAFAHALTLASLGAVAGGFALPRLIGEAGYAAALGLLVVIAILSGIARREHLASRVLVVPFSLLAFLGLAAASLLWSFHQWATLAALPQLFAVAVLGCYIALNRDLIQIVRALGDILRLVLIGGLLLELLVGVLLDLDYPALGILGLLDEGGPIQGLVGDPVHLGMLALLGAATFGVEAATRSVPRALSILSFAAAALTVLFTSSVIVLGIAAIVAAGTLVLLALRRAQPELRTRLALTVLSALALAIVVGWALRNTAIGLFERSGELGDRVDLWRQVLAFSRLNLVEGWGWVGEWPPGLAPYLAIRPSETTLGAGAGNVYLDVLLQLGLVGLAVFLGFAGLTLTRSWLVAARQRSAVAVWPALMILVLGASAVFTSAVLSDLGWLSLVVCSVVAARRLSWRTAFERIEADLPGR